MRQTPDPAVRAAFSDAFADAPDLSDLSHAARRVLVEAATLFHACGSSGTSMRDVARACGLTPGALYRHFEGKDELLYRLVRHGHDSLESRVAEALAGRPRTGDAADGAAAFVRGYVLGHLTRPEMARLVRREYVHLTPSRRRGIVERRRAMRSQLAGLLADGVTQGRLALLGGPDAPTRTAMMVLDMCSRTSEWYDPARPGAESPDELAGCYVEAAMRLVGAAQR